MIEYIYEGGDTSLFDGIIRRDGVVYCPYCGFEYEDNDIGKRCSNWYDSKEKIIQIIVQHLRCHKDDVIIISKCIQCGEMSWVHRSFHFLKLDIKRYELIDEDIIEKEEKMRIVRATEEWNNSLCKTCKRVTHTNEVAYPTLSKYGVWVDCISRKDGSKTNRSGSPKKECENYKS